MEKSTEVGRCCFCGGDELGASEGRGLRERLFLAVAGLEGSRCTTCERRFAASPLHSGRRRHRHRKRRSLEERLEPPAPSATPRWVMILAVVVTTAAVLGGLVLAERGFAPFNFLRPSPPPGATP